MSHSLEKFYSNFGGVDSRSNALVQNPKSARRGSKNFRTNYQDELQQREGFQHKTAAGDAAEAGLIEYKFRDINTGESKTEILGVSFDGKLRKLRTHSLKLTRLNTSSVVYYSLYYDATAVTHKIVFYSSALAVLGSVNISLAMLLGDATSGLVKAINDLALTGLSALAVDEDGNTITSTELAYLLDVVYQEEFEQTATDVELNSLNYWELIDTPDSAVPFVNAVLFKNDPNYEGISYINSNNAVYITDGGFMFKYDGTRVYRAGMPKILQQFNTGLSNYSGFDSTIVLATGATAAGDHRYRFQLRYKDINGVQVIGKVQPLNNLVNDPASLDTDAGYQYFTAAAGDHLVTNLPAIRQCSQFPVYACEVTVDHVVVAGSNTVTIAAGHNLVVGMALRFLSLNITPFYLFAAYFEITAVSATSVTFNAPAALIAALPGAAQFTTGITYNGCYVPDDFMGNFEEGRDIIPYGPTYFVLATKVTDPDTWYIGRMAPVPYIASQEFTTSLDITESQLVQPFDDVADAGGDLPRSGKYVQSWQGQIVQAGRPVDAINDAQDYYPTLYSTAYITTVNKKREFTYSESGICDFQSVFWADPGTPEGFPQSGLNEESFENVFNDQMTGIFPSKEALFCFKERTTAYLTGTLATSDIVKEFLEADVGCATQNSIQEVKGTVVFMDQNLGFWSVVAGRLPEFLGYPLQDYFKENAVQSRANYLNFKRAKSANFRIQDQYICYVPAGKKETGETATLPDPTSSSVMFAFDYAATEQGIRAAWYVWQGINAAGGMLSTADDKLLISQRQSSNNRIWKQKFTDSIYDFSDHTSAIALLFKQAFLTGGEPIIDKAWVRCVISSVSGGFDLTVNQYGNFIDTVIGDTVISFPSSGRNTVKLDVKSVIPKLSGLSWGFENNTIHQAVKIDGWEIEVSPSFDRGEPKK